MFTIAKRFEFSASHVLAGLADDHPCARLHGHNYIVEVELRGDTVDGRGFVLDYGELAPFKRWIDDTLDHRHINDVVEWNPTAEHLAVWLHTQACNVLGLGSEPDADVSLSGLVMGSSAELHPWVSAVRVYETPKTVAEYRP